MTMKSQKKFLTYFSPKRSCFMKVDDTWDKLRDVHEVCDKCLKEVSLKEVETWKNFDSFSEVFF